MVKVESSRYAMALMSANLFGNPARQMTMIGVTGTKGKTTTTHMIKSVLEAAGRKVGMIGTNGIYYMGRHKDTANTTPESYELQKTFREFLDAGCDTALMEVSSQGLMMDLDLFLTILFVILIRLLIAESFLTTYSIISSNEWWENILNIARK